MWVFPEKPRGGDICVSPGRESPRENCFSNEQVVRSRPESSPKGGIWVSPARKRRVSRSETASPVGAAHVLTHTREPGVSSDKKIRTPSEPAPSEVEVEALSAASEPRAEIPSTARELLGRDPDLARHVARWANSPVALNGLGARMGGAVQKTPTRAEPARVGHPREQGRYKVLARATRPVTPLGPFFSGNLLSLISTQRAVIVALFPHKDACRSRRFLKFAPGRAGKR